MNRPTGYRHHSESSVSPNIQVPSITVAQALHMIRTISYGFTDSNGIATEPNGIARFSRDGSICAPFLGHTESLPCPALNRREDYVVARFGETH